MSTTTPPAPPAPPAGSPQVAPPPPQPALAVTSPSPDTTKPGDIFFARIDATTAYFERLGICVAVGIGGMALIHYQKQVLALWPLGAAIVGILLLGLAFFLMVFTTFSFVQTVLNRVAKRWVWIAVTGATLPAGLFFCLAAFHVAATELNPPPAPIAKPQQCPPLPVAASSVIPQTKPQPAVTANAVSTGAVAP